MKRHIFLIILSHLVFINSLWSNTLKEVEADAVEWMRGELRKQTELTNPFKIEAIEALSKKKCHLSPNIKSNPTSPVFAFLSFSVPEETWIHLSEELVKVSGTIVIQGLPKNSFVELSKKIQSMTKKGLAVPVQINPALFEKYRINLMPTFVVLDENGTFDKVAGNVSFSYALNLMSTKGESEMAKSLLLEGKRRE